MCVEVLRFICFVATMQEKCLYSYDQSNLHYILKVVHVTRGEIRKLHTYFLNLLLIADSLCNY